MIEKKINHKKKLVLILLFSLLLLFFFLDLIFGTVSIPFSEIFSVLTGGNASKEGWEVIILHQRIPHAFTAIFSGAALGVSGLLLQTFFKNALAGPSVLGISSGAGLGVALLVLGGSAIGLNLPLANSFSYHSLIVPAAFIGAMLVALLMSVIANRIKDIVSILIVGMMMGYLTSSIVSILVQRSSQSSLQQFALWGLGSFDGVSIYALSFYCLSILIILIATLLLIKPLNLFLLGDDKAISLGMQLKKSRTAIIILSSLLAAIVTAYCGPISFIGITVPHLMRMLLKTSEHQWLIPACIFSGAILCSIASLLSRMLMTDSVIPINAITSMMGAPVVIWIILSQRKSR